MNYYFSKNFKKRDCDAMQVVVLRSSGELPQEKEKHWDLISEENALEMINNKNLMALYKETYEEKGVYQSLAYYGYM